MSDASRIFDGRLVRWCSQPIRLLPTMPSRRWLEYAAERLRSPLGVLSVAAGASLPCGLFVAPQGFLVLAAIGFVVVTGCLWPAIGLLDIRCSLQFDSQRGREGEPVPACLAVRNRFPWPAWGLAVEGHLEGDRLIRWSQCGGC